MRTNLKLSLLLIACCFIFQNAVSQDLIFRTKGDTIRAKVTEVGTNAISYKKHSMPDGPTFVEYKDDILMIKYGNGEIQKFAKTNSTNTDKPNSSTTSTNSTSSSTSTAEQKPSDGKIKIERDGKKFTINGQKSSRKKVNEQLGKSKNPLVILPLKVAKLTKGAQIIVKITSIPSSIGGGFALLATGINMYNDIHRGRDNTKTYTSVLTSLVGTLTLPITNKILKKKSDKMYDKIIDAYNLTN